MTIHAFDPEWNTFSSQFAGWLEVRAAADEPLYALPEKLVDCLAQSGPRPAVLDSHDWAAECALAELCRNHHSVGIWRNRPVGFSPLDPSVPSPPSDLLNGMRELGWTSSDTVAAQRITQVTDPLHLRLKGWAGLLLSEPTFLAARDEVRQIWQSLTADDRWQVPLARTPRFVAPIPKLLSPQRASRKIAQFVDQFDPFCDRWELAGMATWDLPSPDGPKLAILGDLHAQQLPPHYAVVAVPASVRVPAESLHASVNAAQAFRAEQGNWGFALSATSHFEAYAQMLEIGHYEHVVSARYVDRTGPAYAFVSRLEEALSATLNLSIDHIQRLRKQLKACRRGKRPSRLC